MADGRFSKIGQYPPIADLLLPSLSKYEKFIPEIDRDEYARAVGLASHGIGIGSFVYLRRIFERLVDRAAEKAATEHSEWDAGAFRLARMEDKIKIVEDYLPDFIVTQRRMYSILSDGIHNLSEGECKKHFPIIRDGIELVFDQITEAEEKAAKIRAAATRIAGINPERKERRDSST